MIRVTVFFQAGLKRYGGGNRESEVSLRDGASVDDLVEELGMPEEDVWVVGLNGVLAERSSALSDQDSVEFFEPVAGG